DPVVANHGRSVFLGQSEAASHLRRALDALPWAAEPRRHVDRLQGLEAPGRRVDAKLGAALDCVSGTTGPLLELRGRDASPIRAALREGVVLGVVGAQVNLLLFR